MRWFAGMPKKRSKFGEWLDTKGISQSDLSKSTGISHCTINELATGYHQKPTRRTGQKLMKTVREIDPEAKESDFWNG